MLNKVKDNFFIIISLFLVFITLVIDLMPNISLGTEIKLFIYIFASLIVFVDMKLKLRKQKEENKEAIRKKGLLLIFIIYIILLVTLLLIDSNYGRFRQFESIKLFSKEHIENYSNIVPFATIMNFFNKLSNHEINTNIVITNILGNILAFAPFGLFIPLIFEEKFGKFKNFLLLVIGIILIFEIVQFVTFRGTFDIDDIILNTLGAIIVFWIFKIPILRKVISDIIK